MYQIPHTPWAGIPADFLNRLAVSMDADLQSPNSAKLRKAVESGDWAQVLGISAKPEDYTSALAYFRDVLPTFVKKAVDLTENSSDRTTVTHQKWWHAEHQCYRSNQRLFAFRPGTISYSDNERDVKRHLGAVAKIIKSWIGDKPDLSQVGISFSPGSTFTDRGAQATVADKLKDAPSSTVEFSAAGFYGFVGTLWHHNMVDSRPFASELPPIREDWFKQHAKQLKEMLPCEWERYQEQLDSEFNAEMRKFQERTKRSFEPLICRGGEYFTVPKTALVERSAELQPSLNIATQLTSGQMLRRRLERNTGLTLVGKESMLLKGTGWSIERAQDVHRKVAAEASVSRSFATIDLSSASDMVSKTLVEILLPKPWFDLLNSQRTHRIKGIVPLWKTALDSSAPEERREADSGWYLLEKFSSMGNGFTFELETIIFASIACYVTRANGFWGELGFDVFVFGDDIIVRDELAHEVIAFLEFCGFEVNASKSFMGVEMPFRESCGADFFDGVNVRPFYVEKIRELELQELVALTNQVKKASDRLAASRGGYNLNRTWFTCLGHLPRWIRDTRGPDWLGDAVIQDPNTDTWITHVRDGRIYLRVLHWEAGDDQWIGWNSFDPATVLACATLGQGDGRKGLLPRRPVLRPELAEAVLSCLSTGGT